MLLLAATAAPALAMLPVEIGLSERQSLAPFVEILRDPSGKLEFERVRQLDAGGGFRAVADTAEGRGYLDGATWARLVHVNPGRTSLERWIEVGYLFQQSYTLFVDGPDGAVLQMESGTRIAAAQRPLASRLVLFPLRFEPGERKVVYLRVAGRGATALNLALWEPGALLDHQARRSAWKYLGLGASLLVVVYSFIAWRAGRRAAFLAVGAAHVLAIAVGTMLDGFHFSLVPADDNHWMGRLPNVALFLGMSCHAVFAREYLALERHSRRLSVVMLGVAALCLVLAVLPLLVIAAAWFSAFAMAVGLILTLATIVALRWEPQAGALYLAAWGLFWAALVMRNLQLMGWLPGAEFVGDLPFVFVIGMTCVLAYALHVEVRTIRERGELAQRRLFELQQDEQARLLRAVELRTAELGEAKRRAEQASAAKSAFLSTASHELRTPLHTILGYVQLLRRPGRREADEKLAIVERAGTHLLRLIDEVLDYSRSESRRPMLEKRPMRLADLTQHLQDSASLMVREHGNRFVLELDPGLPAVVLADEQRLSQVLLNLTRNACTHTRRGTVRLRIRLAKDEPAAPRVPLLHDSRWHALRFEVEDDGCGIDGNDLKRIFEPFTRVGIDNSAGLGLGLTISNQLVLAMGGAIEVESQRGLGSRFQFVLRLCEVDSLEHGPQRTHSRRIVGHRGRRRHLLIIDDIADNRTFLRDLCASWGFAVAESADAASVLDACCAPDSPFDAVVVDQFMPLMDGWAFLAQLRQRASGNGNRLPLILLSAAAPVPPKDFPADLSFDRVLIKPLRFDALAGELQSLLGIDWIEEDFEQLLADSVAGQRTDQNISTSLE